MVGPDIESLPWVNDLAGRLGLTHTVGQKTRRGDRSVEIVFAESRLFEGQPVLLFDDIVSSGGTLVACAKALDSRWRNVDRRRCNTCTVSARIGRRVSPQWHSIDPFDA